MRTGNIVACLRITRAIVSQLIASVVAMCLVVVPLQNAQAVAVKDGAQREYADLAEFDRKAALSKELGATHMLVTEGLPLATWEMDQDDPYPMWFVHHAGLLTVFPPRNLQPFVDRKYAADVQAALKNRCRVLAKYGLKGVWSANEPAVLPEAFFTAHPELRGPRIDPPNRSRKTYFAPNVDEPETLRMYRDSMQLLLKTCPAVAEFHWVTTDAGSGFDWAPSLYPGINGNTNYKDRPMSNRVAGFLINAQQAAKDAGHEIQINLVPIPARQWMIPTFSPDVLREIVRQLPRGVAIEGREGPDGRHFAGVTTVSSGGGAFYPVVGIVVPSFRDNGETGGEAAGQTPERLMINLGNSTTEDFNYRLFKFTLHAPMQTLVERVNTLHAFAVSEVGAQQADKLMQIWSELNDVENNLQVLNFGDVLRIRDALNRWITRPLVPFPEDLTPAEKEDYGRFLFQAKGEAQCDDFVDIQATRMYEGWGARLLFQRAIEITLPLFARLWNSSRTLRRRRAMRLHASIGISWVSVCRPSSIYCNQPPIWSPIRRNLIA
jgi:hypothetical protein